MLILIFLVPMLQRYVLQKCPNLRTIQSEAGCGTGQLRVLARRHGVRIEHVGEKQVTSDTRDQDTVSAGSESVSEDFGLD